MEIIGNRRFVEIPGDRTHELPPLLVLTAPRVRRLAKVLDMAAGIVESEDMLADSVQPPAGSPADVERRKMDLAINLAEQYIELVAHWQWGDSILEWIRQCEMTFGQRTELRTLLRPDVWPHAARTSFVTLLEDKAIPTDGVDLEEAVGLRLTFRQPPPISCFSNQFLFYLNSPLAAAAYRRWAALSPEPTSALPPERFTFQVVDLSHQ